MAANSAGGSVATLPLYFASNAFDLSSVLAIDASMAGSVGDAKRSLRSQRTVSAPVEVVALAIAFSLAARPVASRARGPASGPRKCLRSRRLLLPPARGRQ